MGNVIDISAKLTNERPVLKLAEDKVYEIDDRKNTVIKMDALIRSADTSEIVAIEEMIKLTLGKEAAKEIEAMNLPMRAYQTILIAIMAAVQGEDFKAAEARFRKAASAP